MRAAAGVLLPLVGWVVREGKRAGRGRVSTVAPYLTVHSLARPCWATRPRLVGLDAASGVVGQGKASGLCACAIIVVVVFLSRHRHRLCEKECGDIRYRQ